MNRRSEKILIIDDEPRMVQVLTLSLEEAGFQVCAAFAGKEGLRLAYEEHPDLILLDIMMPGMDGFEVLQHLRLVTDVPVIMLTAAGYDVNRIRGMDNGAADFITKGTNFDVLLAYIRARLRGYERRALAPGARWLDDQLEVDVTRRVVRRGGEAVNLTPLQWR